MPRIRDTVAFLATCCYLIVYFCLRNLEVDPCSWLDWRSDMVVIISNSINCWYYGKSIVKQPNCWSPRSVKTTIRTISQVKDTHVVSRINLVQQKIKWNYEFLSKMFQDSNQIVPFNDKFWGFFEDHRKLVPCKRTFLLKASTFVSRL